MKASCEVVEYNVADVVLTSPPCGEGYTPGFGGGCTDPDME